MLRWSGVSLYSWLITTSAMASFFRSSTMRIPWRSDSSRTSAMVSIRFSLTKQDDLFDEEGLVLLVGDLGDDDGFPAALVLLHIGLGAHEDGAAPGFIGLADAGPAADKGAGGEIRTGDMVHQLVDRDVRVVDHGDEAVHHLHQVMGRDIGGHAHGDAGGAVDQQIWNPGGENHRLHDGSCRRWERNQRFPFQDPR